MELDTFYVVQIQKGGKDVQTIDYPKDFPVLAVGDQLTIKDPAGREYRGFVYKRNITIAETFREIRFTVDCS